MEYPHSMSMPIACTCANLVAHCQTTYVHTYVII